MKSYLMQALASDPELQVAAGLQIVNLSQAFADVTKKGWPSNLELSLRLQHALLPMIEGEAELRGYFGSEAKERRIGPFCDVLSTHFLRYAIFGKNWLSPWQEALWRDLDFSARARGQWQIHLFGFGFLPRFYFSFFEKLGAQFYLFSPCQIFWGDFYSEKEKKMLGDQLDFFDDQNPFLANWGKVGRKMLLQVEEGNIPSQEHYKEAEGQTALERLQNSILEGMPVDHGADESLTAFSAVDRMHEVETLKTRLLTLFERGIEPRDIQVFAPDINLYAPFIEAVFAEIPHSVSDLQFDEVDPVAKAFKKLIQLPKKRFKAEDVLQFLETTQKFALNLPLIRRWVEKANIRWGVSSGQRKVLYLQELDEEMLHVSEETGTWDMGLRRLIIGLGHLDDLALVEMTEIEELDQLVTLLESLADDLAPFYDGTRWTLPTWLRFFACLMECYLAFDPGHDLYKQLLQLASSLDPLDREEVPFAGVERVLTSLLAKRGKTHQAPHLQAIRFSSLSEGCVLPGQVIALLGMQEEAIPRVEEGSSLDAGSPDFRPKKGDEDRYLFLQVILSAREALIMSYVRDPASNFGASPLVEALCPIEPVTKKVPRARKTQDPLLPSFYMPTDVVLTPPEEPIEIDIQKLFKFARHPLRFYFHEVLGIVPAYDTGEDTSEFVLSPLTKYFLVREAFEKPIDEVLDEAKKRGDLPVNLLLPMAKEQIEKELAMYPVFPEEMRIEPIQVGPITLVGKLDNYTKDGLLVKGKDTLADKIAFWPQGLIAKKLGLPLLFLKDQSSEMIDGSLEAYLTYFLAAQKTPSPLLPKVASALLEGTPKDLQKGLKGVDDEIFRFLSLRDPPFDVGVIHANWSGPLRDLFGRVDAEV